MSNEQEVSVDVAVPYEFAQLQAAALACEAGQCADEDDRLRRLRDFYSECQPDLVLELIQEHEAFEEGMRELASYLGAGGYNAAQLSAAQLLDKVRWGVDYQCQVLDGRIQGLVQERDALKGKALGFDLIKAAIGSPEHVFMNMKAGAIAKPSLANMVDLYGDVVNGQDAQLLEIARLRGQLQVLEHAAKEVLKWSDFQPSVDEQPGGYVLVGVRRHALNDLNMALNHRDLLKAVSPPSPPRQLLI